MKMNRILMIGFMGMMVCTQAFAINREIDCPDDTAEGAVCWQCGSNCYATLTGTTLNITGTGALDNPGVTYSNELKGELTNATWKNYDVQTVNIGKNITSIGQDAFIRMQTIKSIHFEDGSKLQSVGQAAFLGNYPQHVILPSGVHTMERWAFNGAQNLYCTAQQIESVCKDIPKSYFRGIVKQYQRQGDKLIITYNGQTEIYNLDFTEQYDEQGNVIGKYDEKGNMLQSFVYGDDGSVSIYDASGKLIGLQGKRILTVEEATALVKDNKNTFTLKYR